MFSSNQGADKCNQNIKRQIGDVHFRLYHCIVFQMAGVTPEIPGIPSQSQLMALAAGMQGANALSYLGIGAPGLTPGKPSKIRKKLEII